MLGEKVESDVNGVSLSAVGFLPVGPVDLFARVGAINWNADLEAPGSAISGSDDGTDLTYGVGAQFRVWSLSVRGEYERFDISRRGHRRPDLDRRDVDVPVTGPGIATDVTD